MGDDAPPQDPGLTIACRKCGAPYTFLEECFPNAQPEDLEGARLIMENAFLMLARFKKWRHVSSARILTDIEQAQMLKLGFSVAEAANVLLLDGETPEEATERVRRMLDTVETTKQLEQHKRAVEQLEQRRLELEQENARRLEAIQREHLRESADNRRKLEELAALSSEEMAKRLAVLLAYDDEELRRQVAKLVRELQEMHPVGN